MNSKTIDTIKAAICNNNIESVKKFIAEKNDINASNGTLLITAALKNRSEMVKLLIKSGADIHHQNYKMLYWLVIHNNNSIVNKIIKIEGMPKKAIVAVLIAAVECSNAEIFANAFNKLAFKTINDPLLRDVYSIAAKSDSALILKMLLDCNILYILSNDDIKHVVEKNCINVIKFFICEDLFEYDYNTLLSWTTKDTGMYNLLAVYSPQKSCLISDPYMSDIDELEVYSEEDGEYYDVIGEYYEVDDDFYRASPAYYLRPHS
jgi:hypothetical protein